MLKFDRNYYLQVQLSQSSISPVFNSKEQFLNVAPPFSIEFDVNTGLFASINSGRVRIYNLSRLHRDSVRRDFNGGTARKIILNAGYGQNLPMIINADIMRCWSVREGVNFITEVEFNIGMVAQATGEMNQSFPKGTPLEEVLKAAANFMPGISGSVIGSFPEKSKRGNAYAGNASSIINELTGDALTFCNDNKAYCLNDDEVIHGNYPIINSESGLLGTPTRDLHRVHLEMIFEPRLLMFQYVTLESKTDPSLNGPYKVTALRHRGVISPVTCGEAITSVTLDQIKDVAFVV